MGPEGQNFPSKAYLVLSLLTADEFEPAAAVSILSIAFMLMVE
jgi:hypothetical protein